MVEICQEIRECFSKNNFKNDTPRSIKSYVKRINNSAWEANIVSMQNKFVYFAAVTLMVCCTIQFSSSDSQSVHTRERGVSWTHWCRPTAQIITVYLQKEGYNLIPSCLCNVQRNLPDSATDLWAMSAICDGNCKHAQEWKLQACSRMYEALTGLMCRSDGTTPSTASSVPPILAL